MKLKDFIKTLGGDEQIHIIVYDDQDNVLDSIGIVEKHIQNKKGDVLARALNYLHSNLSFNNKLNKVFMYEVIFPKK